MKPCTKGHVIKSMRATRDIATFKKLAKVSATKKEVPKKVSNLKQPPPKNPKK